MSGFWSLAEDAAARWPDKVLFADDHGGTLTALQLKEKAERVAAGLGVGPGDVVSWQLPTTLDCPVLMLALARVGAMQNPVIAVLREREVRAITSQVGTTLFICPETWRGFDHAAMARDLGLNVLTELPEGDPSTLPPPPDRDGQWRYFSSGTTADPKGAKHTDASLIASSAGMTDLLGYGFDDVYPIAWPFPHIGGATMLAVALRKGTQLVLFDTFDPATTPERMAAFDPTILGSAQPFFRAYLDAQRRHGDEPLFPHVRVCTAGGAPTPAEIVHELAAAFGITGVVQSWGLTEFPIATCATPGDPADALANTVGRPCPGVDVRVVDGELRLKGPQCFAGYLDSSLDAEAFDEDGWFRTGDLGEVRDDGNVVITGRLKDVIIRNAENISALEIEDILLRHPGVADVAVIGLPDGRTGERVCAVIVPRDGAAFDVPTVFEHCVAQGLAKHKCPEQVEVVAEVERNGMGKILKQNLRAKLLAG